MTVQCTSPRMLRWSSRVIFQLSEHTIFSSITSNAPFIPKSGQNLEGSPHKEQREMIAQHLQCFGLCTTKPPHVALSRPAKPHQLLQLGCVVNSKHLKSFTNSRSAIMRFECSLPVLRLVSAHSQRQAKSFASGDDSCHYLTDLTDYEKTSLHTKSDLLPPQHLGFSLLQAAAPHELLELI